MLRRSLIPRIVFVAVRVHSLLLPALLLPLRVAKSSITRIASHRMRAPVLSK